MPTPKYQVFVDFNENGDFDDANEEITSDIRSYKLVAGKKLERHSSEAAVLELFLNNEDHKYSPSFTGSPLYPNVLPAPNIWFLIGYPVDDFIAADDTNLTSRKPSHDDLFDVWEGDTGDFKVASNKLIPDTTGNKTAVLDFFETDCFVGVEFVRGGVTSGLILRWSDANNYLMAYHDGSSIRLGKVDSGVLSSLGGTAFTWAFGTTKRILVELHGDVVRISINDNLKLTVTTTFNNTATKFGVGGRATFSGDKWSNFGGWRPLFHGRIDLIDPRPEISNQYAFIQAFDDFERASHYQIFRSAPAAVATAKDIINEILDGMEVDSTNRVLDSGQNLITKTNQEKSIERQGLVELHQVQDDDVGHIFIDGSGYYRYEDSDHRDAAPHITAIKTWRDDRAAGDQTDIYFSRFVWDDGKDRVENEVFYEYFRITRTTNVEVWSLDVGTDSAGDRPKIKAGETEDFLAVGDGDHIANPIPPRRKHTQDINFNTSIGGGGTDLLIPEDSEVGAVSLASFVLTDAGQNFSDWNDGKHVLEMTDSGGRLAYGWGSTNGSGTTITIKTGSDLVNSGYAYSDSLFTDTGANLTYDVFNVSTEIINGFEGNFRSIRVYNGSGSDGFLTLFKLFADKGVKSSKITARASDAPSQFAVGRRSIRHQAVYIDRYGDIDGTKSGSDKGSALDRAAERIKKRRTPKPKLTLGMGNGTRANLMQIVHRSFSDRIRVVKTDMTIDDHFFIERREISGHDAGLDIECEWELERVIGSGWASGNDTSEQKWNFFNWA